MPEYYFEHPKTKKVKSIIMTMKEDHVYIDKKGVQWNRIFFAPEASFDTVAIDPFSKKDFLRKTENLSKGAKLGDVYDRSKEMHLKRMDKTGNADPIALQFKKDYEKARKNKKLPVKCGSQYFEGRS